MTGVDKPRGLALLGEVLLVGVLLAVAALPVLTLLPALGAACALLRGYVEEGRTPTARHFARLLWRGVTSPVAILAPAALLCLAGLDTLALLAGLPGGTVVGPPIGLLLLAIGVAGLRAAAAWRPDRGWSEALRTGAARVTADPAGSVLLAGALVAAALIAAQVPVFLLVLPGLLVLAVVAVDNRGAVREVV
jgi:hypothetical protein